MKRLSLFLSDALDLPLEFPSSELVNDQQGTEKQTQISGQKQPENEALELQENDTENTNQDICLDTSISFQGAEDLVWQQSNLGEYRQLSLWKSTPTLNSSLNITSQEFQFTPTSETTTQSQENSICYQLDFLAQAQATQEVEQDSSIQNQHFGEKDLDVLSRLNPASVLSNNLKELSDEDFELFLADSLWQDIQQKLKQSRQQSLGRVIKDEGFLLFPTLTSGQTSSKTRPAGQTKCEKWFKDNGLIPSGSQLGTSAIALTMGFPFNWFEGLKSQYSNKTTISSLVKHQDASEQDISQEEVSHQDKPRSLLEESSISIPCLIKQPGQDEFKGVIREDLGDRFVVYIPSDNSTLTVSKLFVYPNFSKSVPQGYIVPQGHNIPLWDNIGQIEKNPSKNLSPSKKRRRKGEGNGCIYWRTITKNGKDYPQAYYHWKENGRKRSKYIPKHLLVTIQSADNQKRSIAEILSLLGEKNINPSKTYDTLRVDEPEELDDEVIDNCEISPSKIESPSKSQRHRGEGSGSIHCKPIKRGNKTYPQYWYH
jgi:hypothetical protein